MTRPTGSTVTVLIVDDEAGAVRGIEYALDAGHISQRVVCQDSRQVLTLLEQHDIGVVLLDLVMPHLSGEEVLDRIVALDPDLPVIVLTGRNDVEVAVTCMKRGAFDYLVKPVDQDRIVAAVHRAIALQELRREHQDFKRRVLGDELEQPEVFAPIVTNNRVMRSIFQYTESVACSRMPILIEGETGVGKELLAVAIHALSGRDGDLVTVNVAGLDDHVFADTLFGHHKGAFTGADTAREGLVARAAGGTILLDEIGDLSMPSQVKLLRLLQEQEYLPLGADVPRRSKVRFLCATNRDLDALQASGAFRRDLYYRVQTHRVCIPPLRCRPDDIPLLVEHFLEKAARASHRAKPAAPRQLFPLLATYSFPGNVRELESMVVDAMSRTRGKTLPMAIFTSYLQRHREREKWDAAPAVGESSPYSLFRDLPTLKESQRLLVEEALRRAQGNQTRAARLLGISQPALSQALKRQRQGSARAAGD